MQRNRSVFVEALERLVTMVAETRRRRVSGEAPIRSTEAYASLILANAFARLGRRDRAETLCADAVDRLVPVLADPVHAYLCAAYRARLDLALTGMPRDTALPDALVSQLEGFDRAARYKADRLREMSRTLGPDLPRARESGDDAMSVFGRNIEHVPDRARNPTTMALRAIIDPDIRAREIEGRFAQADVHANGTLLGTCLGLLLELPEREALPLLVSVVPTLLEAKPRPTALIGHALSVAARFGYGELVPGLLAPLGDELRRPGAGREREIVVAMALHAVRRLGLRRELEELVDDVERGLRGEVPLRLQLALAGSRVFLHDTRAATAFDRAHASIGKGVIGYGDVEGRQRIEVVRAIAEGVTHASAEFGLRQLERLEARFQDVTDKMGTSTHYCISVLEFVDVLALAVVDLAIAEASPTDPVDAELVALTYALE